VIWASAESPILFWTPAESFKLVITAMLTPPMMMGRIMRTMSNSMRVNPSSP
jgi:hypothetical protein